jgi:hypothetical protein
VEGLTLEIGTTFRHALDRAREESFGSSTPDLSLAPHSLCKTPHGTICSSSASARMKLKRSANLSAGPYGLYPNVAPHLQGSLVVPPQKEDFDFLLVTLFLVPLNCAHSVPPGMAVFHNPLMR